MTGSIRVVSALPGRIRFKIAELRKNQGLADKLKNYLARQHGVEHAATNAITGSLLILYTGLTGSELQQSIASFLSRQDAPTRPSPSKAPLSLELSSRTHLWQVVITSLAMLTLSLRKIFRRSSSLAASPLVGDFAVIITVTSGYPLLKNGLSHLTTRGKISHELLLSMLSLLALVLRENLVGLATLWLVHVVNFLRTSIKEYAADAIWKLTAPTSHTAWVIVDNTEIETAVEALEAGQLVRLKAGEEIPADGIIKEGRALISQALLTGESNPLTRQAGDQIYAGTRVETGSIVFEVTAVGRQTLLGEITRAATSKVTVKSPQERAAVTYIKQITVFSGLLAIGNYLWTRDYRRSLAILLAAAPSEISLAIPTALGSAVAQAAAEHVIITHHGYLEELAEVEALLFDKTGTLTGTASEVTEIIPLKPNVTPEMLVALAASLGKNSQHPLARAFLHKALQTGIKVKGLKSNLVPGHGLKATVQGNRIVIGSAHFMQDEKINLRGSYLHAKKLEHQCSSVVYIAYNGELLGLTGIKEAVRPEAPTSIKQLQALGVLEIGLLTGDSPQAAAKIADQLGIERVWAAQKPAEKMQVVQSWQAKHKKVGMIGDGINDIPALRQADVGIALGSEASVETLKNADIVIPHHHLSSIPRTILVSKKAKEIIKQNLALTIGLSSTSLALALGNLITPGSVALLHQAGKLAVILNSARLWPYGRGKISL